MKQSLAKSSIYLSIASLVFMLSAYIINIFLGRYLGPIDYGTYGIIISLMTVVNLIQTSGLPQALSKNIAQHEQQADAILKSGLVIQIVTTLGISVTFFLLASPLAFVLNDQKLIPYIQLSSFIFPIYGLYALYTGYYNGLHDFRRQSIVIIIYSTSKAVFVIFFTIIFSLSGAIAGFIISPLFSLLAGLKFPKKNTLNFSYKKLLYFSLPLISFALFSTLLQSIDLFFIKALTTSDKDTGFYTANQNIARIPYFAFSALSLVLFPSISRSINQNQLDFVRKLINKSLRIMLIFLIPGIFIAVATSTQLIEIIYSDVYLPGTPSLVILLFASGFFTLFTTLANIMNSAEMHNKSVVISILAVIITAFGCLMLIPTYGLNGAALATTIGTFVAMILACFVVYNRFETLTSSKSVIKIIISSIFVYFLAKVIIFPTILLPILFLVLFAIYLCVLFVLKEITIEDVALVKSLISNKVLRK